MKQLTLVFLLQADQVLLAMKKRGFGQGRWNGVGGKVEEGESIEQAMIRETQEEIGVTPSTFAHVATITFHEYHEGLLKEMTVTVFLCSEWDGEPNESEEMAPRWFKHDALPYDDMWPDDPYWLPQVLKGKKLRASFTLDANDTVLEHTLIIDE